MSAPVFTQQLTVHLNGGSKFSELHRAVHIDGRRTAIVRFTRTDGRPRYLITADIFVCGGCGAEYDLLAPPSSDWKAWLLEHDHVTDGDRRQRPDAGDGSRGGGEVRGDHADAREDAG